MRVFSKTLEYPLLSVAPCSGNQGSETSNQNLNFYTGTLNHAIEIRTTVAHHFANTSFQIKLKWC